MVQLLYLYMERSKLTDYQARVCRIIVCHDVIYITCNAS